MTSKEVLFKAIDKMVVELKDMFGEDAISNFDQFSIRGQYDGCVNVCISLKNEPAYDLTKNEVKFKFEEVNREFKEQF